MKRENVKKMQPILNAFAEGKEILFNNGNIYNPDWIVIGDDTSFNYGPLYYKIKEEPNYIPFTQEDWASFLGHAVRYKNETKFKIIKIVDGCDINGIILNYNSISYKEAFDTIIFKLESKVFGKLS